MALRDASCRCRCRCRCKCKLNSRYDDFVGSDTLAELVWSPRTGLNIKFADKKPCFTWEVGPSDMGFLQSEEIEDQKHVRSVASQATCHVNGEVAKSSSSVDTQSHGHTGPQNQRAADPLSEHLFEDGMTSGDDGLGPDIRLPLKVEAMTQCGPREHVERSNKTEKGGCFSDPSLENAQEAIWANEKRDERGDSIPGADRERPFYCRENDEKHEDVSHRSMESCSSVNVLPKRKKRLSFEQQLILESKRIKKQTQEFVVKKDSSFVNWISNMVKGLKNYENHDPELQLCDESRSFDCRKMGFQNGFWSLFSPDAKAQETTTQIENKSVSGYKEMVLADKCSHGSLDCLEKKEKEAHSHLKPISLYERVTKEAPKGMFDTIRRLRLSRTDILKWTNSRLSVSHLDGFFLRLRLAKWDEGAGGARYYVACITGSQGENRSKGFKKPICVNVGGVECFVESRYVSNCDFLEDELVLWWQKTSKSGGTPVVEDLKSKLAKRKKLGL